MFRQIQKRLLIFAKIEIHIIDMRPDELLPVKFMLTIFGAVAELEREYILQRQREGIAEAKRQGKYSGSPANPLPPDFERVVRRWRSGEITAQEAMHKLGMKPNTFYRRVKSWV